MIAVLGKGCLRVYGHVPEVYAREFTMGLICAGRMSYEVDFAMEEGGIVRVLGKGQCMKFNVRETVVVVHVRLS